ncbi:hypothetical protein BCR42DRAFT_427402 [Absidia repens]|uniref:Uncharacterized protein n=1 Tax=Absidia repens TaxID=90262 RepID=A0A1X2I008_9FUNG|nr:hypothetical protein BCR42DRAFT_427402 [Absidia repens]
MPIIIIFFKKKSGMIHADRVTSFGTNFTINIHIVPCSSMIFYFSHRSILHNISQNCRIV